MTARREHLKKIRARRAVRRSRNNFRYHVRQVLRPPYYGERCHGCKHIPPQPGEVMEPDWRVGLFKEEEGNA